MMAYELVVVYLNHIEISESASIHLGSVYNTGGQDTKAREAEERGGEHYGDLFRRLRGEPRERNTTPNGGGEEKVFNNKFNRSAGANPCHAFNWGTAHPQSSLAPDGTCRFAHVCMQWVSDKGPGGICRGNHPKSKCTNPNKVDQKVMA